MHQSYNEMAALQVPLIDDAEKTPAVLNVGFDPGEAGILEGAKTRWLRWSIDL
jgi:hypothetical protein